MRKNTLKEKLAAGKAVFGLMISFPSAQVVEMLGYMGYDWVVIDTRHTSISLENSEPMIMAAELSGIAPMVRVGANRREIIAPFLDLGAWGVHVPHVHTADEARAVVDAVKYFPLGHRGLYPRGRSAEYGFGGSTKEYTEAANRETLVCIIIEDVGTLQILDEMVRVDGVDMYFIGSGHLSSHMGYPGDPNHPDVLKVVERGIRTIRDAGKVVGVSYADDLMPKYLEMGVQYFHSSVNTLIQTYGQSYLDKMRDEASRAGM